MSDQTQAFVNQTWDESILPALSDFIRIPALSPAFDSNWKANGHLDQAAKLMYDWSVSLGIDGLSAEILELPGRTPLLYIEIPGDTPDTVLLYGHFDKQPEAHGWWDGFGPWTPKVHEGRLYGRGSVDDGYALFSELTAIEAVRRRGGKLARCVVIIEGCEESGSFDLPFYIDHLASRIGTPSLIVCLDSGCGNYEQLWCTTSLRGNIVGNLTVEILKDGVHSGDASGVVPSSFRILRQLLSRVEDETTGRILVDELTADISDDRMEQARTVARILGDELRTKFPFVDGASPTSTDPLEMVLNRTFRPTMSVTGADGLPPTAGAGNVLRPSTTVKLSFRTAPGANTQSAAAKLKEVLEADPPYGAHVRYTPNAGYGFDAPPLAPWLGDALQRGSQAYFGRDVVFMGEGASIPLMGMLGQRYPDAQFLVTGALGPHANAHGPNEFLHLDAVKKITACVAEVLAAHGSK
ncbi:MAG: M20/M25/M40 family metallo-hydrolase [Candidatus Eisenbacteria bacterium]|uniref:M20/M25/M40 family metallo-hydrolase n=1 Tax=Eiseniibacteriota bacterium TaxID=2212470 RepID=A0A956SFU8_UNCEI|nr:M20/M25/M40 family metallo-hydrolase [Candidatus Eisenbacteria bacterium]